jgi:hypothetical protein
MAYRRISKLLKKSKEIGSIIWINGVATNPLDARKLPTWMLKFSGAILMSKK